MGDLYAQGVTRSMEGQAAPPPGLAGLSQVDPDHGGPTQRLLPCSTVVLDATHPLLSLPHSGRAERGHNTGLLGRAGCRRHEPLGRAGCRRHGPLARAVIVSSSWW